jgi:hypothetical protein
MGGGLMQLVAYGAQDIYLTGNPQITFFKVVYRRHTNFSMENIQQTFKGTPKASSRVVATISRNGDLVHECYLKIPDLSDLGAAVKNPGHNIINYVECEIGGQLIDRQFGYWMETHAELTEIGNCSEYDPQGAGYTIGSDNWANSAPDQGAQPSMFQLTAGAGGITFAAAGVSNLYVPLRFWFNRHVGLSLPLIALQYHEVNINVAFTAAYNDITNTSAPELWVNYIYLDTDERRRFAQVSHEYLIEQVQVQTFNPTTAATNTFKLNFNHPVKELVWICPLNGTVSGVWGKPGGGSIGGDGIWGNQPTVQLKLNGHDRFAAQSVDYFTRYQPMLYHKNYTNRSTYLDSISVYSFALKPEEHQPSGTCNFSRIDSAQLVFDDGPLVSTVDMHVFAVNYNVLRIMSGMGGLAYSN